MADRLAEIKERLETTVAILGDMPLTDDDIRWLLARITTLEYLVSEAEKIIHHGDKLKAAAFEDGKNRAAGAMRDLAQCNCDPAYTERGRHATDCWHYWEPEATAAIRAIRAQETRDGP